MDAETWSIWLIGAGSLVIVLGLVVGSERPYEGVSERGPFNTRGDRLRFAVEGAGAALVAVGSAVLAIVNPPSPWLPLVGVRARMCSSTFLAAWKLHQYWAYRLVEAERAVSGDIVNDFERSLAVCARTCSSWRWCLRHPFNGEYWPRAELRRSTTG